MLYLADVYLDDNDISVDVRTGAHNGRQHFQRSVR